MTLFLLNQHIPSNFESQMLAKYDWVFLTDDYITYATISFINTNYCAIFVEFWYKPQIPISVSNFNINFFGNPAATYLLKLIDRLYASQYLDMYVLNCVLCTVRKIRHKDAWL